MLIHESETIPHLFLFAATHMATRIHRFVTEHLLVITLSGVVRGADILNVLDRLTSRADTPEWARQLWDCSGIFELDVDWPELRHIKSRFESLVGARGTESGRWAIVAPRDTVYQFSRALHAVVRTTWPERQVFRTMAEARVWLDVHPQVPLSRVPVAQPTAGERPPTPGPPGH